MDALVTVPAEGTVGTKPALAPQSRLTQFVECSKNETRKDRKHLFYGTVCVLLPSPCHISGVQSGGVIHVTGKVSTTLEGSVEFVPLCLSEGAGPLSVHLRWLRERVAEAVLL